MKYAPSAIHSAVEKFVNFKQPKDTSDQRYLDKFNYAVRELKRRIIVLNVPEVIINQENGDVKA